MRKTYCQKYIKSFNSTILQDINLGVRFFFYRHSPAINVEAFEMRPKVTPSKFSKCELDHLTVSIGLASSAIVTYDDNKSGVMFFRRQL